MYRRSVTRHTIEPDHEQHDAVKLSYENFWKHHVNLASYILNTITLWGPHAMQLRLF